jgi:hypothetical protein
MTHCILPTDIELAKKLLTSSRPDNVIISALVQRGVDSASAAQLVTDLRNGRQVAPQIPAGLGMVFKRRSRSRKAESPSEPQPAAPASETHPQPRRTRERHSDTRKSSSTFWLIAAVPICFVTVIIGVLISNHRRRNAEEAPPSQSQPAAPARAATSPAAATSKAPSVAASSMSAVGKKGSGTEQLPAAGSTNTPAPQPH